MRVSLFFKAVPLVAAGLMVAGCASNPSTKATTADSVQASRLIAEKVAVAADAQRQYVDLVRDDKVVLARRQAAIDTDAVDVDFIGKPQELFQTMAFRYGYQYVESGRRSELRTINVRVTRTAPIEVLRNVGYQLGTAADVELDKNSKTLRLIYGDVPANKG
ncbi:DotD/TraH family lipoprotein (plasmid) [Xanthomonas campestris pv. passiflorae]